jgi:glutathione S-transferase
MKNIRVTAFRWVPPFAQGLVRDLRVRWALEEAGLPYEQILIGPDDQKSAQYRQMQPFGQVPVFQADDITLFESGSIVMYIAEKSGTLLPSSAEGRARTLTWVIAALNSIEPHVLNLNVIDLFNPNEEWAKQRRPAAETLLRGRLAALSQWMGDREYLEGSSFTAADLVMTTVLRFLRHCAIVADYPNLAAFKDRGEARPAFQRAHAAQLANFEKYKPATAA